MWLCMWRKEEIEDLHVAGIEVSAVCTAALQKEEVEDLHVAVAGREGLQHADSDDGWRLGQRGSG